MKTRARSENDKLIKKRRLLDAAKELFSSNGFQGATVGTITARAGESTGTFYLYFSSKTEVYRILTMEGTDLLRQYIENSLDSIRGNAIDKLHALGNAYYRFYREQRAYYDIISIMHAGNDEFYRDTILLTQVEEKAKILVSIVEDMLEEGIREGALKSTDVKKTTTMLWGMIDGLLLLDQRDIMRIVDLDLEETIHHCIRTIVEGLRTP